MTTARRLLLAATGIVVALALAALALLARGSGEKPTYLPIARQSSLATWRAPWNGTTSEAAGECGAEPPQRWLVVGWDSAYWNLLLPLVDAGRMPNLESLMKRGAYGDLRTFVPSASPALWTTVATGVSPARHGILHFYHQKPALERWKERLLHLGKLDRRLYANTDRRARALWNLLSDHDRTVVSIGYHNTYPVEEVNGVMISNYFVQRSVSRLMQIPAVAAGEIGSAMAYPTDELPRLERLVREVEGEAPRELRRFVDLDDAGYRRFLAAARRFNGEGDVRPYFLERAWVDDMIKARAAEELLAERHADVTLVHFQGPDWVGHRFLYFHEPEKFAAMHWSAEERRELEAQLPQYRRTLDEFYVASDEELGRLIAAAGEGSGILLLSDHGMEPADSARNPGDHDAGPPGIVVAAGPGIRPGERLEGASLYDILPTLMAAERLPVADDLPGHVLEAAFCPAAWEALQPLARVATYTTERQYSPTLPPPPAVQDEVVRELEALGYLD